MSIKFLLLGGGVFSVWGGGKCRFYFYGRGDFSDQNSEPESRSLSLSAEGKFVFCKSCSFLGFGCSTVPLRVCPVADIN